MAYVTRLNYLTFRKEGDELVITSERDDSFEQRRDWPDDLTMTDEDLASILHERYYTDAREAHK